MDSRSINDYSALDVADKDDLDDMQESHIVATSTRRVRPIWISALAALLLLFVLISWPRGTRNVTQTQASNPPAKILLRLDNGFNGAGLGSAVTQARSSAIYASVFNRSLVLNGWPTNHHGYDVDPILSTYQGPLRGRFCMMSKHCPERAHKDLMNGCGEKMTKDLEECRVNTQHCDVLVDDRPWNRDRYCTGRPSGWIREAVLQAPILGNVQPLKHDCAWHFRWGDLVGHHGDLNDRVTNNHTMELVSTFARKHGCASISIFMQHATPEFLAHVSVPYTIIDSGDVVADIQAISSARIIVLSDSGIGPIIVEMAQNANILVQKSSEDQYHWTDGASTTSNTIHFIEEVVEDNVR